MSHIVIQPRVDRETYFRFKRMCQAHATSVEHAIEELMRVALKRAGVELQSIER